MSGRRASIAGVMKLTAIIALSLGLLRFVPTAVLTIPIFVFLIVLLELAIVQAFFGRPLRTFYFTFLIVGALLSGTITYFFFGFSGPVPGSLPNLEAAIQNLRGTVRGSETGQGPNLVGPLILAVRYRGIARDRRKHTMPQGSQRDSSSRRRDDETVAAVRSPKITR